MPSRYLIALWMRIVRKASDRKTRKAIIVESHAVNLPVESPPSLRSMNLRSGVRERLFY
jgi:hypothetical protein